MPCFHGVCQLCPSDAFPRHCCGVGVLHKSCNSPRKRLICISAWNIINFPVYQAASVCMCVPMASNWGCQSCIQHIDFMQCILCLCVYTCMYKYVCQHVCLPRQLSISNICFYCSLSFFFFEIGCLSEPGVLQDWFHLD